MNKNVKMQLKNLKLEIEGYAKFLIKNLTDDSSFWGGYDIGSAKTLLEISILLNQLLDGKIMDSYFSPEVFDKANEALEKLLRGKEVEENA